MRTIKRHTGKKILFYSVSEKYYVSIDKREVMATPLYELAELVFIFLVMNPLDAIGQIKHLMEIDNNDRPDN